MKAMRSNMLTCRMGRSRCAQAGCRGGWRGRAVDDRQVIKVEPGRFEEMVSTALDGLRDELGQQVRNVAVTAEHGAGPPGLLGLYEGIPLTSRTFTVRRRAARPHHHLPACDLRDLPHRGGGRRPGPPYRHPRDRPLLRHRRHAAPRTRLVNPDTAHRNAFICRGPEVCTAPLTLDPPSARERCFYSGPGSTQNSLPSGSCITVRAG
jgi:hypothetical protein